MKKKLINYNDRLYKLNNEALRRLISEDSNIGPEAKIKEIISVEDMGNMLSTIKNWYYGNSGTDDIESLQKITHYYGVPVTKILIQTDETWEYVEEAKKKPGERTLEASKEVIKRWLIEAPADNPDYVEAKGIEKYIDQFPKGLYKIFLFYIVCVWPCTFDFQTYVCISPLMLLLIIEYAKLILTPYFKKKKGINIWQIVSFLVEAAILITMAIDIISYYIYI